MMFYNAAKVTPLELADDYTEGGKVIYINSNMKPSEAVRRHPELQVCAEIEQWARDSEALGELQEKIDDYSAEISGALLSGSLLDDVFEALNNGLDMEALYCLLEHKQNVLNDAYDTIDRNLDKIYELVTL